MSKSASSSQTGGPGNDAEAPYRDRDRLKTVYEQHDTIDATANFFDVSSTTIRNYLCDFGLHVPESEAEDASHPVRAREIEDMDPEDVGLAPLGEGPANR